MTDTREKGLFDLKDQASPARSPLFVAGLPEEKDGKKKINRILIANRGEIASRVVSTCRKLGLTSISVYVDEDASSRHISDADEAINLGSVTQQGGNPYLNIDLLIRVALSTKADAIHPGYGYLSENAEFSDSVKKAGIAFVGPSSKAMLTLGNKRTSKEFLQRKGSTVPLIPGYAGSSQDIGDLQEAAESIGYPVMLKASAGGGGRGMRIVRERSQLKEALKSAQSEAQRSFGLSDCIIEKYIEAGKHIEIQIVGDSHGNVFSFGERECSVQRRHQKVIEETPSPFLNSDRRNQMSTVAVQLGKLLGYEGAGTVEFVVDVKDGSFYFLEVNTRLQVEHPITEEVTNVDLVALQFYVAAGGNLAKLTFLQHISQSGHSIECRLCAEDPIRGFLPEQGTVHLWRPSDHHLGSRDVRFETAIQNGATISVHFDSMIAKLIVWAPTRRLAIAKMVHVLANTVCAGIRTNQLFLQRCLLHPEFRNPSYTTSFIDGNLTALLAGPYSQETSNMKLLHSVVPGAILRYVESKRNRPFQYVRTGFRSQPFDPVNLNTEVTLAINSTDDLEPMVSIWKTNRTSKNASYELNLWPISSDVSATEEEKSSAEAADERVATRAITARYNAISNQLRNLKATESEAHKVSLKRFEAETDRASRANSWMTALVEITVDEHNITAQAVIDTSYSQAGGLRRVLCHFPSLGTWLEYRCYSLLAYLETLRETAASEIGVGATSVKAPMPCTVLSVLKKVGETVKTGDVVMVIESMKMEMNTSITADGKFNTNLKPGDAVDEGKVLCWVD